jgi:O-antigen ligase
MICSLHYLLLALLPFVVNYQCFEIGKIKTTLFLLGGLWLLSLWSWSKKQRVFLPVVLYFSWALVSWLYTPFKYGNPLNELLLLLACFGVYITAPSLDINTVRKFSTLVLVGMVLYYLPTFNPLKMKDFIETAVWGQSNIYAGFLVIASAILLQKSWWLLPLPFLALWLTGSRAGMLGFGAMVLIYFGKEWKRAWYLIPFFGVIGWKFHLQGFGSPDRISFWRSTAEMIRLKPLVGWGLGSFRQFYPPFKETIVVPQGLFDLWHTHNDYLELIAELGFIGLILFGWVILRVLRNNASNEALRPLKAGIIGILVMSLFDSPIRYVPAMYLFWLYLGLLSKEETNANAEITPHYSSTFDKLVHRKSVSSK